METETDFRSAIRSKFEKSLDKHMPLSDIRKICTKNKTSRKRLTKWIWVLIVPVVCAFGFSFWIDLDYFNEIYSDIKSACAEWECLLDQNEITMEITRPIYDCNRCKNVKFIPIETDISNTHFENIYAYTGVPVVIKNGARNWTAQDVFSVNYFRSLYTEDEKRIEMVIDQCQFLPYFTGWDTLIHALNMDDDHANLNGTRWYIGWSNCVPEVEEELRKHYSKPDFLPKGGGSVHIDWIFMGGSGVGAPPHIDSVGRPSWQAQLQGRKTWFLDPPPECDHVCSSLSVVMNISDILVVDTDLWYHSTFIHPGEMSITIGSEYD